MKRQIRDLSIAHPGILINAVYLLRGARMKRVLNDDRFAPYRHRKEPRT